MIETMDRSSDAALGFVVSGDVTKADYQVLDPTVGAAIEKQGTVALLLDLTDFHWEKVTAWRSDVSFGREYHDKITRMAIVGNKKWERHLAHLAAPYYAREAQFFETVDDAWVWVEG